MIVNEKLRTSRHFDNQGNGWKITCHFNFCQCDQGWLHSLCEHPCSWGHHWHKCPAYQRRRYYLASWLWSPLSHQSNPISIPILYYQVFWASLSHNSQHCVVIGIGVVYLNLPRGSTLVLHDAWHFSNLRQSVVSIRQINKVGFRSRFLSRGCLIHKGNLLHGRGSKVHTMYLYMSLDGRVDYS